MQKEVGSKDRPMLIDVNSVARMLGIAPITVWRLVSAGKIPPGIKLGGSRRWNLAMIERFVEEGCPATGK